MSKTVTVIDFETGGLDANKHQITEVAMLNFNTDTLMVNWEYQSFIKPYLHYEIDPIVYQKTRVTEKDVMGGKDYKEVYKEMVKLLKSANSSNGKPIGNTIIAGHNFTGFDIFFIQELFTANGDKPDNYYTSIMDTLPIARMKWVGEKCNLTDCCKRTNYDLTGAHGAMEDVRANFHLIKYFQQNLNQSNTSIQSQTGIKKRKYFNF